MIIHAQAIFENSGYLKKYTYRKTAGPDDIVVRVRFCTLSRGDVFFAQNHWGDSRYPLVPGLEIIGENVQTGETVGIGYQVYSCGACSFCRAGTEQFCKKQKVIPLDDYGGLSDVMIVNRRFAYHLSKNFATAQNTPLLCSAITPFSSIRHYGVKKGMRTGVVGIGNVGHLAVQILNANGCHVTAFTHTPVKKSQILSFGANTLSSSIDPKSKKQLDFILVTTYANLNWDAYLKLLSPEGTLCFVGLPTRSINFKAESLADYGRKRIVGSYNGSRSDMIDCLSFCNKHGIRATITTFPFEKANDALQALRTSSIPFSTVITL